ncbi:MAG: DUF1566 domain-containing protein, partial [Candidatus Omnitrophica bacterium]|nr:DUF1566 domain-containing protein [Candidatus Omnitrophota bacterium]
KAQVLLEKIPNLSIRPMLLTHINDLIDKEIQIESAYDLYGEMVDAWLIREEKRVEKIDRKTLLAFSEHLAIDLWINRRQRGSERLTPEEAKALADQWQIPIQDWQLTGRSLLNRDVIGNLKFAHRSIMEFLFVKRFLEGDKNSKDVSWSDQMQAFLWEKLPTLPSKANLEGADLSIYQTRLRSSPIAKLEPKQVKAMLFEKNFYCSKESLTKDWCNPSGGGMEHFFRKEKGGEVVDDYATGLIWEQSGSEEMNYENTEKYIKQLNRKGFSGFNDWRLPTLEEAMSLMERVKKGGGLYIDPVFSKEQGWIWTADRYSASLAWSVGFHYGYCFHDPVANSSHACVRAVRSGPTPQAAEQPDGQSSR